MAYEDLDSRLKDSDMICVLVSDLDDTRIAHLTALDPDAIRTTNPDLIGSANTSSSVCMSFMDA